MKLLKNLTYHKKIFWGMLLASAVPVLIYFLSMTQLFSVFSRNALEEEATETLELTDAALKEHFAIIFDSIDAISSNGVIKEELEKPITEETPILYRQLFVLSKKYGDMADFCIYDSSGQLVTYVGSGKYVQDKLALDWGILFETLKSSGEHIIRNAKTYTGAHTGEFVRAGKTIISDKGDVIGFAVAVITQDNMNYILQEVGLENRGVLRILDDFHEMIYASMSVSENKEYLAAQKSLLSGDMAYYESDNKNFRYYHLMDEELKLHLFYRQTFTLQNDMLSNILLFGAVVGFIGIVLSLIMSGIFSRLFYSPIEKMKRAIDSISQGDYKVRIPIENDRADELASLMRNVNLMTETLEENTTRLVERERELGNTNIQMMQAQLNPHFIYNTLDTIKWIGKANDVPEVAVISSGLARILRSSISSEQIVPLKKELDLVEAYIEIQRIRFDDKFEFVTDISEIFYSARVPKLILQPVIENSIVHGFEDRDRGMILLRAEREDEDLIIQVLDDGCGIDEETLLRLNAHEDLKTENDGKNHSGIGVKNAHGIIQLHYGEKYGLSYSLREEGGTCVTYRLPLVY